MKIDNVFTEKERYQILREAGYTPTEARKYRRFGGDKFINMVEATTRIKYTGKETKKEKIKLLKDKKKHEKLYANTYIQLKDYEKKTNKEILKPDPIPIETPADFNYTNKYNYVMQIISKNKIDYVTYTTNTRLDDNEINNELNNYIQSANRRYRRKIKNWRLKEIQVK